MTSLTQVDLDFLERLNTGEERFDEKQRKRMVQIFTKILSNPTSIKAREWIFSELLKINNSLCSNCWVKFLTKTQDSN